LRPSAAQLHALSPLRVLGRGYALVRKNGAVVRDASALSPGEVVDVTFAAGSARATIQETEGESDDR
jgi:exodeoxyribonuclease VII large subunit